MQCNRSYDSLSIAYYFAQSDLLNAVAEYAGQKPNCQVQSYTPPPVEECQDAASFGSFQGHSVTCGQIMPSLAAKGHSVGDICNFMQKTTITGLMAVLGVDYKPPSGLDPTTTLAIDLCKGTCMAVGAGPCWLRGPAKPWCGKESKDAPRRKPDKLERPPKRLVSEAVRYEQVRAALGRRGLQLP